jgi:hypothetical protein
MQSQEDFFHARPASGGLQCGMMAGHCSVPGRTIATMKIGGGLTVSAALEPAHPSEEAAARQGERRALGVACGAHALHDGYTDLVWVALPIWQAEFGLSYAAVGLARYTAAPSQVAHIYLSATSNLRT